MRCPTLGYSKKYYNCSVSDRSEVLLTVMHETGTTQSELSRLSGVRQPSISQFCSDKLDLSDGQLDRLLSCMGYRLEISRRPVSPTLTRSERRSWMLHRELARQLTPSTLAQWHPRIKRNLRLLRSNVKGQPHLRNVDRWESLVARCDVPGLQRILTGLGRDCIEMREVSPLAGLLADEERIRVLRKLR